MKTHIQLKPSPEHARVIVCGSPERARLVSEFLTGSRQVAQNREYHSYLGTYANHSVLVASHGVGSAGAAICFQELIDAGAQAIIRIGTAGGLADSARISDIVLPVGAVRKDGASTLMVPPQYPALPDFDLTSSLHLCLEKKGIAHRRGIVLTSDLFYPGPLGNDLDFFKSIGVLAVEMECSTLFVIGLLRGVRTGALLVLDGNPLKWSEGQYDPDPNRLRDSLEKCIEAALSSLIQVPLSATAEGRRPT
ncbi:MAG: nucleoside phosphorylase [Bdellovibrionales bacterium]